MTKNYFYSNSFVSGFLYIFGLSENPAAYLKSKYNNQNDANEIAGDWRRVGGYIQKSINTYIPHENTSKDSVVKKY